MGWFSLGRLFGKKQRPADGRGSEAIGPGVVGEAAALPLAAPTPVPAAEGAGTEEGELADSLLADARKLDAAGDRDGALAVLGALLDRAPDSAEARAARAKILLARGEYARAAADYRRAVALGDDGLEAHYGLGTALEKWAEKSEADEDAAGAAERYRDAALEYKAVLWRRPDYPPACYSLGCVYARMGKKDDALYYFRKALGRVEKGSDLERRVRYAMKLMGEY